MKSSVNRSIREYPVLQPSPAFLRTHSTFSPAPQQHNYQLSRNEGEAVRLYHMPMDCFERTLSLSQWRHQSQTPIVRCLYLQLPAPKQQLRPCPLKAYLQHMEVTLRQLQRVMAGEAIYLLMEAIRGYRVLWDKFKAVSVNADTIGLDTQGKCLVWLNREVDKLSPQSSFMVKPTDIIQEVLTQVRARSEPSCNAFLGTIQIKLNRSLKSNRLDSTVFDQALAIIGSMASLKKLNVPTHLKYMVSHRRVTVTLEQMASLVTMTESTRHKRVQSPCFKGNSFREGAVRSPTNKDGFAGPIKIRRVTTSCSQPHSLSLHKRNVSISEESGPSNSHRQINQFLPKRCMGTRERCKTQSYEHIEQSLKAVLPSATKSIENIVKRKSGMTEMTRAGGTSFLTKSKHSQFSQDMFTNLSGLTSIWEFPTKKLQSLKSLEESESVDRNSSEENDLVASLEQTQQILPIHRKSVSNDAPTFHQLPQEQVFKTNKWATTLRNLLDQNMPMDTSITEGQDVSHYLSDVKLDRLNNLSRQLSTSLMEGSDKRLPEPPQN